VKPMTDLTNWSAIFTGVIAVETLVYIIFTWRLWQATKQAAEAATESAKAAKVSADASKQSADISANLQRPFIGLTRLDL
jgi:predicted negative regulator of RcsB-dependent stress response